MRSPDPSPGRHLAGAAGLLSGMVLLSRLLGFVRDSLIAFYFGQTVVTSAYRYAFTLPDTLWMLIAGGVMYAAYVPVITDYMTQGQEERAWRTYSIITTFLFVVLSVVIPVCWIFAKPLLSHFLARGFPETSMVMMHHHRVLVHPLDLAVEMTRIVLPAQYCFFLGSLMMGMLQSRKMFLAPALGPVIYNLGIILGGLFLAPRIGIEGFSWGALGGAFVGNLLIQIWAVRSIGARFQPSLNLRDPGVRRCGRLALPIILGISLPQADSIINGMFVGTLGAGKAILENANRLMQLPLGIFGQAIGMAVLPTLSQQSSQKDIKAFRRTVNYGVRLALFLTVPATVLLIVLARPLTAMVYQRGAYTAADTRNAVPALICYAVGIPAWSAQAVLARAFYAREDTWPPVLSGTFVTFCIFLPLNFILFHATDVPGTAQATRGLALGTSIAATVHASILMAWLKRRTGRLGTGRLWRCVFRIVAASAPLAMATWFIARELASLPLHGHLLDLAQLVLAGGTGLAVYLLVSALLGSEEVQGVGQMLRRRKRG